MPRTLKPLSLLMLMLLSALWPGAARADGAVDLEGLARQVAGNTESAAALRAEGPAGLVTLRRVHAKHADDPAVREAARLVAGQKDAHAAWLYWHTDLDAALVRARSEGKPVLSLRLLGRLDEDLSCANSRFFRTVLYPDPAVNELLRERYVLHWQSVRPVPRVTVDFGDGRKLERTVVGNSVHLLLDERGRVLDAMPGLVAPGVFATWLDRQVGVAQHGLTLENPERFDEWLKTWHYNAHRSFALQLTQALAELGVPEAEAVQPQAQRDAVAANRRTMSKRIVALPMLEAMGEPELAQNADANEAVWAKLSARYEGASTLSEPARALVRAKQPLPAERAHEVTAMKMVAVDPLIRVFSELERNVALDTARNEFDLHRRLHGWYARGEVDPEDVDALVYRIYDELFLSPLDDPWHGLTPDDAYTALDAGGRVTSQPPQRLDP